MSGLAEDLEKGGYQEQADYYRDEGDGIRAHIMRNMDGEVDTPAWCD